ncbi:unnamed protein product [Notodromas monacha]|uniref:Golgin subfamily A conserved domain-containing protein n=1 Tax=Notodromas monacha TaxID=399045 RepID=A0A7R9GAG8_9CRUS|nr:unnamed protein product [Notodromas monacha]CAG0914074.1 unnamed protein product [Notodromas monacha]
MDDASRKERLLAARKKLREYQQKKNVSGSSPNPEDGSPVRTPTPTQQASTPLRTPTPSQHFSVTTPTSVIYDVEEQQKNGELPTTQSLFGPAMSEAQEVSKIFSSEDVTPFDFIGNAAEEKKVDQIALSSPPTQSTPDPAEISAHLSTIRLLVDERSSLEAELAASRSEARLKDAETQEANNQLAWYRKRVSELEAASQELKCSQEKLVGELQRMSVMSERKDKLETLVEEQRADVAELGARLNGALAELDDVKKRYQESEARLKLADLRLASTEKTANIAWWEGEKEKLLQEKAMVEAEAAKKIASAKSAAEEEWSAVVEDWRRKTISAEDDVKLLQQKVCELEKAVADANAFRLERLKEDEERARAEAQKAEEGDAGPACPHLDYDALVADHARLRSVIVGLEADLEDARRVVTDSQMLAATAASDQLAASRALAQNRTMKKQLDELQEAFVKMSHSKMAAANELDSIKHEKAELIAKRLIRMPMLIPDSFFTKPPAKHQHKSKPGKTILMRSRGSSRSSSSSHCWFDEDETRAGESPQSLYGCMPWIKFPMFPSHANILQPFISIRTKSADSEDRSLEQEDEACKDFPKRNCCDLPKDDFGTLDEEVRGLRAELVAKADALENSRKELLCKEGIEDRLQHYHVQHRHLSQGLELQLVEAKTTIEELRQERNELKEQLADIRSQQLLNGVSEVNPSAPGIDGLTKRLIEVETEKAVLADKLEKLQIASNKEGLIQGMSAELENKFKALMDNYAAVCDQKQQLEHLCTQLQGETDTIGEYVALYRVQRSLLTRQAEEKEMELRRLNKEREVMRQKLAELEGLVVQQLKKGKQQQQQSSSASTSDAVNGDHYAENESQSAHQEDEYGSKIMAVLSEVKESDLIAEQTLETCCNEAFHPCVCCSGKLITV